jgi:8-oxo-dGTP pyrophosphatase MutT (NUDIX family)
MLMAAIHSCDANPVEARPISAGGSTTSTDAPAATTIVPSANFVVVNDDSHVLLIRRSDNGNWALPGGAMDVGGSLSETAVRETVEETGIEVVVTGLVGISPILGMSSSTPATVRYDRSSSWSTPLVLWVEPCGRARRPLTFDGCRCRTLTRCPSTAPTTVGGRAVVIEMLLGELGEPDFTAIYDLAMLALTSGMERLLRAFMYRGDSFLIAPACAFCPVAFGPFGWCFRGRTTVRPDAMRLSVTGSRGHDYGVRVTRSRCVPASRGDRGADGSCLERASGHFHLK